MAKLLLSTGKQILNIVNTVLGKLNKFNNFEKRSCMALKS